MAIMQENQENFLFVIELDGVGPFDNRPSADKLHHFVRKKIEKRDM